MPPESIDRLVGETVLGILGLVVMYKDQENRIKDNSKRRLDKYAKEHSKNRAERRLLRRFIEYNDLSDE
ncbi:hypothetical protein A2422_01260 [Candidatus Woesebacteria bacterium RIFOXYC1_FULL_31_51]|uniref:Uncharacterized protein n=1 Tax=Candidatus Woesebacteria bacterium GW2011_GWC2_31_9 TaxID=1618586 RepID=A0A0F9YJR2_9BACT|nr:MAG: hypothetical protein UR17_C0001G0703 [Candidatus Woesebacteria bacterium GW2011_GWF1_31_35]KKP22684.1 MAG: hypothetical protein UR11_C0002G0064 [Candidatus Woesebacteria bacterium GW2011_GWC1_30_29]KKP25933.1 MAG: hypothetical protein UR13_C0006G0072 [Candidatus Woesebacteria bacterium GW2011_GWD1_31_12]KKP27159.1 MAG: hypothetical protein UR16_C0006G0048 [Candidatus Woesebacteria bacterium GW2011_GWB1_31_29]KKP31538.1 MAG: hypothetical protein UR21_C0008G0015 [Candidatus Woesebacteria 